jgi:DNA-binding transcriptional MerR regulator
MYTPSQVAKRAGNNPQTIRNYSKEFAPFLSPGARVTHGARLYTDEDMQILCIISDLRKAGAPRDEIIARLKDREVPPIIDLTPQQVSKEAREPSNAGQETALTLNAVLPTLNGRFEAIERHIDALERRVDAEATRHDSALAELEQQRKREVSLAVTFFMLGAIAILVIVAFALRVL